MILMIIGIVSIWWLSGASALLYDWHSEIGLHREYCSICIIYGLIVGPVGWLLIFIKKIFRELSVVK